MFEIYNNRKQFWQWDVGQRLIVKDDACTEVHFCNGTSDCAPICEVYEEDGLRLVNVPNILFQTAKAIRVFAYVCNGEDQHTKREKIFPVYRRTKPEGYVYTETEIKNYAALERRISELEKNGVSDEQIEESVKKYLSENPIAGDGLSFDENGKLKVETTDSAEADSTMPISSAGVHAIVGNIGAILDTI